MASKDRYVELADRVVELVGGKENISYFTHCITRLRFNVKDKGLVKVDEIQKVKGVMGAQWSGDQFQIIIGQAVGDAYDLIVEKTGLARQEAVSEDLGDAPKAKLSIATVFDAISGCIAPVLPVLIGTGLIQTIVVIINQFALLPSDSPTLNILTIVGNAGFYFLPVFVGANAAKKFGANMGLGMLVGAMLIHPDFISAVSNGDALSVFGLPIYGASYSSTVFPVILAVAVMAPIERVVAKYSPDALRSMTEPLITLLIMIPLTYCALAPVGSFISTYLAQFLMWAYGICGPLVLMVFNGLYPLLVMVGMHTGFIPIIVNQLATYGSDGIMLPGGVIVNINQGIASAVVALKSKDTDLKSTALSASITAIVGGVTEPALFGVNLKLKTPLYAVMIGSAVGSLVVGIAGVRAYTISGSMAIFGFPMFLGGDIMNFVWELVGIGVGIVVTFILTYILYKPEDAEVAAA